MDDADIDLSFLIGHLDVHIAAVAQERAQRSRDPARLAEATADLLVSLARVVRATAGR